MIALNGAETLGEVKEIAAKKIAAEIAAFCKKVNKNPNVEGVIAAIKVDDDRRYIYNVSNMSVAYTLFCLYKYRLFKWVRKKLNKPVSYPIKNSIDEIGREIEYLHSETAFSPYTNGRIVVIKVNDKIGHIYMSYGINIIRASILYYAHKLRK